MGQKDIVEKMLEDYPDVFADIINVLIFHGEPVVRRMNYTRQRQDRSIRRITVNSMSRRGII